MGQQNRLITTMAHLMAWNLSYLQQLLPHIWHFHSSLDHCGFPLCHIFMNCWAWGDSCSLCSRLIAHNGLFIRLQCHSCPHDTHLIIFVWALRLLPDCNLSESHHDLWQRLNESSQSLSVNIVWPCSADGIISIVKSFYFFLSFSLSVSLDQPEQLWSWPNLGSLLDSSCNVSS